MGVNSFFFKQIKRSLSFSKQRLLIIFISIFMGSAVTNAFLNVYFDIDNKMSHELKAYGANMLLSTKSAQNIKIKEAEQIKEQLGIKKLIAFSPYLFFTPTYGSRQILLAGVDFKEFKKINRFLILKSPGVYNPIEYSKDDSIILGAELAATLDKQPGQRLVLNYIDANKETQEKSFVVKAIIETGDENDSIAFTSMQNAQNFSRIFDAYSFVSIIYDDDFAKLSHLAQTLSTGDVELKTITSVSLREGAILEKIKGLMFLISLVILIISSTSVNTTLSSIIFSRKKEIALHLSLGASAKDIIKLFAAEVFIMALISSILGCLGGYALSELLGFIIFNSSIDFRLFAFVAAIIISLIFAGAAAFFPIKKALSIDIIENLRGE